MKKILAVFLAIAILFTLSAPVAAAEDSPAPLAVESQAPADASAALQVTTVTNGLSVKLVIQTTRAVNNGTVVLSYPQGLTLEDASSAIAADGVNTVNTVQPGEITVAWATVGQTLDTETVLEASFTGDAGKYTFTTLSDGLRSGTDLVQTAHITTDVALSLDPVQEPDEPEDPVHQCPSEHFTDVNTESWYHEAVDFVVAGKLMIGVSDTAFEPDTGLNRATIATVLYRLAGEPQGDGRSAFTDVADGRWYTEAVNWAAAKGITTGYEDGTFRPMRLATREETVTFLHRYADLVGYGTDRVSPLTGYPDRAQVSDYAAKSMGWAIAYGIVMGIPGADGAACLMPGGTSTRAQFATMLMRLCRQNQFQVTFTGDHAHGLIDGRQTASLYTDQGSEIVFSVAVDEGYRLLSVCADDTVLTPDAEGLYTITVQADTVVRFQTVQEHMVTFTGDHAYGEVNGERVKTLAVAHGARLTFAVVPEEGYSLAGVTANGQELRPNADGKYTVTVDDDVTVGMLTAAQSVPPAPEDHTITLQGQHLRFYQDGAEVTQISVQAGTKYITFNAVGTDGYHATTATVEGEAEVSSLGNLFLVSAIGSDLTITVASELNVYTVDFSYSNKDLYPIEDQQITHGQKATEPTHTPVDASGAVRAGWYLEPWTTERYGAGEVFDFDTPITQDMTLYAEWDRYVYTVTFDTDGGSEIPAAQVLYSDMLKRPDRPTREGYTFGGWYLDQGVWQQPVDFLSFRIYGDTTLYARWIEGALEYICLDGRYGTASGCGTDADPVLTFEQALALVPETTTGEIHIIGQVTIPADTEETWSLEGISGEGWSEAKVICAVTTTSSSYNHAVRVNGTLNLEHITFVGAQNGTYTLQCRSGGVVNMNEGTVFEKNASTQRYSCIYIDGGRFYMNGGAIRDITLAANYAYGPIYLGTGCVFEMNGGVIENCTASESARSAYSGVLYAYRSSSVTFNGGEIRNCGGETVYAGAVYDASPTVQARNTIQFNGTDFINCPGQDGMLCLSTDAVIRAGEFTMEAREDGTPGNVLYLAGSFTDIVTRLDPLAQGDVTIDGGIFLNNKSRQQPLGISSALSMIGGAHTLELNAMTPNAQILVGTDGYTLQPEDLEELTLQNDLSDKYELFITRSNALVLRKTVEADMAVYLDGMRGSDENDGLTEDTAVETFARAKEILMENEVAGGRNWIYLMGNMQVINEEGQTWSLAGIDNAMLIVGDHSSAGIYVGNGSAASTLTLENIIIDGNNSYRASTGKALIQVDHGTLYIKDGAVLQNNGSSSGSPSTGSGVNLNGSYSSRFAACVMSGGEIVNNTASVSGGGVYVRGLNATFTMTGGKITHNSSGYGGGVVNSSGGRVVLLGGEIVDNTAEQSDQYPYSADLIFGLDGTKSRVQGEYQRKEGIQTLTIGPNMKLGNQISVTGGYYLEIDGDFSKRPQTLQVYVRPGTNTNTWDAVEDGLCVAVAAEGYTLTANDVSKLECLQEGFHFALDAGNNRIILKADN